VANEPKIVGPGDGDFVDLGGLGIRFLIDGEETGSQFALVEHPLEPRALGAPLHRHANEDEYSYVIEGRMGAQLGDDVVFAGPGELVFKPRGQWHTFWNAGDEPARLLELIAPPGFENYFREMGRLVADGPPDPEERAALAARYELEVDPESVPGLVEEHGLRFGGAK
jgi:quercetin dioxygenase-like cupin family protein